MVERSELPRPQTGGGDKLVVRVLKFHFALLSGADPRAVSQRALHDSFDVYGLSEPVDGAVGEEFHAGPLFGPGVSRRVAAQGEHGAGGVVRGVGIEFQVALRLRVEDVPLPVGGEGGDGGRLVAAFVDAYLDAL